MRRRYGSASVVVALIAAAVVAGTGRADAPPVGPLPTGPTSTIRTDRGELVAFALPHRAGGRVWRIARAVDPRILRQIAEDDIGGQVVLVFRAAGPGTAVVAFALTRGERPKVFESRRYTVTVRS